MRFASATPFVARALLLAALLSLTACRGWARVQGGGAFNTADRPDQSGYVAGVDAAIAPTFFVSKATTFPFAIHTSGVFVAAPERKSLAWGTGLAWTTPPRPVAPYVIAGTTLHADYINGKYSFGNVSPYGEIGMMTPLFPRERNEENGPLLTFGFGMYAFFNYLVPTGVDGFVAVQLGVAYEKN